MSALPRPVAGANTKPAIQQIWEMVNWGSRLVTTPNDYRMYRLFLRGRTSSDAMRYLSGPRAAAILNRLNPRPDILENKLLFDRHFGDGGLPVPQTLATVGTHPHAGVLPALEHAEALEGFIARELGRGRQLVVKPLDGMQGAGVSVLTHLERGVTPEVLVFANGEKRELSGFAREVVSADGVWLIQQRLTQHHALARLNASTVNTVRLGTFLRQDGTVDTSYAVLRVGRRAGQVDGYSAGGLVVRLEPNTGQLSSTGQQKYSFDLIDSHPDSGVAFRDVAVPYWEEVLSLGHQFARRAAPNKYVGWDVAITQDGPVFIEGNHNWDVQLAQVGSDGGLLTADELCRLQSEAGAELDATRLPRPRPLAAVRMLMGKL